MQLTLHTDYSLRVLIYLHTHDDRAVTAGEIAERFGISRNHLMKVVQTLVQLNYIQATRGRGGGLSLARPPESINVGELVREVEPHMHIAECFNVEKNTCPLSPACCLKRMLYEARQAFLVVLDRYHLPDLTTNAPQLRQLLSAGPRR